ncbi:MAG: hypothetical protein M3Z31_00035 [Pseudomonadota bacterium]|nr:hypothetical protein [Pseudomonadota bacterium]
MTSETTQSGMVTGLFPDRASAESAYNSVSSRGYGKDDIHLIMSEEARKRHFSDDASGNTELGNKAAKGAGVGGGIGATVGGVLAAIAAIGTSVAIPGLGLIVAGPLAAGIAGAGAGALTGGVLGALVGWGIPEEHVKRYEQGIKSGDILMGVKPRSSEDAAYFESEWNRTGREVYRGSASA